MAPMMAAGWELDALERAFDPQPVAMAIRREREKVASVLGRARENEAIDSEAGDANGIEVLPK